MNLEWDTDVSRLHAEIEHLGGRWTLADDGLSRNGTYLNGERLRGRRRLVERDRLRFGATNVVYRAPVAARPTTTQGTSIGVDAPPLAITAGAEARPARAGAPGPRRGLLRHACDEPPDRRGALPQHRRVKTHLCALTAKLAIAELPQNRKRARLVELALQSGEISERDLGDGA